MQMLDSQAMRWACGYTVVGVELVSNQVSGAPCSCLNWVRQQWRGLADDDVVVAKLERNEACG